MVRNKHNMSVIIMYSFWQMTLENPNVTYACINYSEAVCLSDIEKQSIYIDDDIWKVLKELRR